MFSRVVWKNLNQASPKSQRGATLLVGLVMMGLLTIVGLAAMNVTTIDVKVVANAKDRQLAFNGAEGSLFEGGVLIQDFDGALDTSINETDDTIYFADTYSGNPTWWSNDSVWSLESQAGTSISSEFQIEEPTVRTEAAGNKVNSLNLGSLGPTTRHGFYPTTAKSQGPGNASVILQSHFVKRLYNNIAK